MSPGAAVWRSMTVRAVTNFWCGSANRAGDWLKFVPAMPMTFWNISVPIRARQMDAIDLTTRCANAAPQTTGSPAASVPLAVSRLSRIRLTVARVPPPVLQGLLAFAIYLAVFIAVYARAVLQHLGAPELLQYFTDPNFYIWSLQWWPYAVGHGINPL